MLLLLLHALVNSSLVAHFWMLSFAGTCMIAALEAGASWVHGIDINPLCIQGAGSPLLFPIYQSKSNLI